MKQGQDSATKREKIVIVGGVAGGATALARLRRLDENCEIVLFERGEYVSFANCGLPYYIGGEIRNRDALFVATERSIEDRYAVDIRTQSEVVAIDRENKTVDVVEKPSGRRYTESYDKLLLSTGASPIRPRLPGADADNVFTLWSIPDTDRIKAFVDENAPRRAVVVGGGFVGLELAENLVERGLHVTLVEMAEQLLAPLDPDMSILIENRLRDHAVDVRLGMKLEAIEDGGRTALLADGSRLDTDLILLCLGISPNSELAGAAGLELNARRGVVVDDSMQTSDPSIWAIGDVVEVSDFASGEKTMIPLAGPANKQGRLVADIMLGRTKAAYGGTLGTSILRVFDTVAASTGLNEKTLKRLGRQYGEDYFVAVIHPQSHAGYFPGASPLTLKLIFAADGRILGSQIVGRDGVDKRIDVIATAIRFGASVDDLTTLELAYAPPFSSAKDPVNMAGYVAQNILSKKSEGVLVRELDSLPADHVLLDVREAEELAAGRVEGSIHIPLPKLRAELESLDRGNVYVTYCAVGLRGYLAERILKQHGLKAKNVLGGYRSISDARVRACAENGRDDWHVLESGETVFVGETKKECDVDADNVTELDASGLCCPGPIVAVARAIESLSPGDVLRVRATDPGFARDIAAWADNTGHRVLSQSEKGGTYTADICRGTLSCAVRDRAEDLCVKEKTMIVFSGDLDKAIASFIIATGAQAMGNKVHMFFTFWGLNILRKPEKQPVKKNFMAKMFSTMMPRGSRKLGLSKMNFGGAGARMIRSIMKKHNVTSLEQLIEDAVAAGVELTACQMSMDLMGITQEELLDGVNVGGVAAMLNDSDHSNMNLFI